MRGIWVLGGFLLLAALLSVPLYGLVQHGGIQLILAPSAASSSNASAQSFSGASTATAAPGATTAPTAAPGATATIPGQLLGTPTPTGTLVSPTPTATLVPPTLEVNPTVIYLPACLSSQAQFTVLNTGGAPFSWTATASDATYQISPAGGTLAGGSKQLVKVDMILLGGTITITAAQAGNSPQYVTITCQV